MVIKKILENLPRQVLKEKIHVKIYISGTNLSGSICTEWGGTGSRAGVPPPSKVPCKHQGERNIQPHFPPELSHIPSSGTNS